jgi:3-hydroxyisobutyrate dehydrogenase-like beta-hydroxyacid dehydrogenase
MRKPFIGFIGMGRMGARMARRLLDAGYPLGVYNRTPARARLLTAAGARAYESPGALAADSAFILSSLADDAAVTGALLGADGALTGARAGAVLVDLSSVHPATSRAVFASAQAKGVQMLDAPVSGSTGPAEEGRLMILVGGERETYERCRPIFDILGRISFYLGPSGAGSTMKLIANAVLGIEMLALAEAIALGEKAGLPRGALLDALTQGGLVAAAHAPKIENARRDEFPATFPLRLLSKDLGNALRLADECLVPMPLAAAARQMYAMEQGRQTGDEDYSAVIRLMGHLAHESRRDPTDGGTSPQVNWDALAQGRAS